MNTKTFHERLIEFATIDQGGGYEWDEWHAYYDPETRLYYTGEGAGCSCDYYDIREAVDQSNGLHSRADVLASLNRYADESYDNIRKEAAVTASKVMSFTPPKGA